MKRFMLAAVFFVFAATAYGGEPFDCSYCAAGTKSDPEPAVQEYRDCGSMEGGRVVLSKTHLKKMVFDRHGLATVLVKGQHYYVKRDGLVLAVITVDNWADDFAGGLVRSRVGGKIAYYDRGFRQVIAPRYDWGLPFKNGRALVCRGCTLEEQDSEGHSRITGGTWGCIDKQGHEVVPVRLPREEAEKILERK
jgi:hypothetical protein